MNTGVPSASDTGKDTTIVGKGGGIVACVDGLNCITEAVGIWGIAVGEAERYDGRYDGDPGVDPGVELRERLPGLLGQLSPDARAMMLDHVRHTADLVAFVHRALGLV